MLMSGFECVCAWCSWRGLEARTWEMFGCICDMCTHDWWIVATCSLLHLSFVPAHEIEPSIDFNVRCLPHTLSLVLHLGRFHRFGCAVADAMFWLCCGARSLTWEAIVMHQVPSASGTNVCTEDVSSVMLIGPAESVCKVGTDEAFSRVGGRPGTCDCGFTTCAHLIPRRYLLWFLPEPSCSFVAWAWAIFDINIKGKRINVHWLHLTLIIKDFDIIKLILIIVKNGQFDTNVNKGWYSHSSCHRCSEGNSQAVQAAFASMLPCRTRRESPRTRRDVLHSLASCMHLQLTLI